MPANGRREKRKIKRHAPARGKKGEKGRKRRIFANAPEGQLNAPTAVALPGERGKGGEAYARKCREGKRRGHVGAKGARKTLLITRVSKKVAQCWKKREGQPVHLVGGGLESGPT